MSFHSHPQYFCVYDFCTVPGLLGINSEILYTEERNGFCLTGVGVGSVFRVVWKPGGREKIHECKIVRESRCVGIFNMCLQVGSKRCPGF